MRRPSSPACGALSRSYDQLCRRLEDFPFAYLDSFALSAYPAAPRCVLSLMAKQLPSFGASLETAVQDLSHYQSAGFAVLVLVINLITDILYMVINPKVAIDAENGGM